jgi:hypothetical protein
MMQHENRLENKQKREPATLKNNEFRKRLTRHNFKNMFFQYACMCRAAILVIKNATPSLPFLSYSSSAIHGIHCP